MKHLGEEIIQNGFNEKINKTRDAARAIIFNDKKEVLCIYSSHYDDVSFPGGGVEEGETLISTLHRESLEEVGAVIDTYEEFYKITEKRMLFNEEDFNIFNSYYYICTYKELKEPMLLDYEIELGYESRWISLDDAIELNTKTLLKLERKYHYCGVVERELRILKKLKEIQ